MQTIIPSTSNLIQLHITETFHFTSQYKSASMNLLGTEQWIPCLNENSVAPFPKCTSNRNILHHNSKGHLCCRHDEEIFISQVKTRSQRQARQRMPLPWRLYARTYLLHLTDRRTIRKRNAAAALQDGGWEIKTDEYTKIWRSFVQMLIFVKK